MANDLNHNMAHGAEELFMTFRIHQVAARLKIPDSRSPVMMTGQIFFAQTNPDFRRSNKRILQFVFAYGISNYAGNRSLYCIDVQVFCGKLVKNSFPSC